MLRPFQRGEIGGSVSEPAQGHLENGAKLGSESRYVCFQRLCIFHCFLGAGTMSSHCPIQCLIIKATSYHLSNAVACQAPCQVAMADITLLKPLNIPVSKYYLILQMWKLRPRETWLFPKVSQPATKPGHSLQSPYPVLLLLLKYSKRCQLLESSSFCFFKAVKPSVQSPQREREKQRALGEEGLEGLEGPGHWAQVPQAAPRLLCGP